MCQKFPCGDCSLEKEKMSNSYHRTQAVRVCILRSTQAIARPVARHASECWTESRIMPIAFWLPSHQSQRSPEKTRPSDNLPQHHQTLLHPAKQKTTKTLSPTTSQCQVMSRSYLEIRITFSSQHLFIQVLLTTPSARLWWTGSTCRVPKQVRKRQRKRCYYQSLQQMVSSCSLPQLYDT